MGLIIYNFVYEDETNNNNNNTIFHGEMLLTLKHSSFYKLILPVGKVISATFPHSGDGSMGACLTVQVLSQE